MLLADTPIEVQISDYGESVLIVQPSEGAVCMTYAWDWHEATVLCRMLNKRYSTKPHRICKCNISKLTM